MANPSSTVTTTIEEKRRLNSAAPISGLPFDVLHFLFSMVRDEYLSDLDEKFGTSVKTVGAERWTCFTHVCHHWRQVAVWTPTLWARVLSKPRHNECTKEMLVRSRRCPHTLIIQGPFDRDLDLSQYFGSCRRLSLQNVPREDLRKYWPSEVTVVAPELCHLEIFVEFTEQDNEEDEGDSDAEDSDESDSVDNFVKDDSIEQKDVEFILSSSHLQARSLRGLDLTNCRVDLSSGFLRHLTHLRLEALPVGSRLRCDEFIKALVEMPSLEEILLFREYMLYEREDDTLFSDSIPDCHWPSLQRLVVNDEVINLARFLKNNLLPPSTKLEFSTPDCLEESEDYLPIVFDWISNHFRQSASRGAYELPTPQGHIRSFGLQRQDDFTMYGSNDVSSFEDRLAGPESRFQFAFDFQSIRDSVESFNEILEVDFLPRLPISSIVFLDVSHFDLSSECWSFFGSIATLQTILISGSGHSSFFSALLPGPGHMPFESLTSIGLIFDVDEKPIPYTQALLPLRERMKLGKRLGEVVFIMDGGGIFPTDKGISAFREVVTSVRVLRVEPPQ